MYRHWIDPARPFAETLLAQAQGVLVTSATLTDGDAPGSGARGSDEGAAEATWRAAEARCGAAQLAKPALRARFPSPFDYRANTRVLVVNDVARDSLRQVASAYRALFLAASGGALGLFTAITRLRAVHGEIGPALEAAGLPLLAQHVDAMDTATLVDIFRAERDACLLGTDAVRDGVDVPGAALRLIVFDRVPWPRPDLRHKAPAGGLRRPRLRRPPDPPETEAGLRPPDPAGRRPGDLRDPRCAHAEPPPGRLSAGGGDPAPWGSPRRSPSPRPSSPPTAATRPVSSPSPPATLPFRRPHRQLWQAFAGTCPPWGFSDGPARLISLSPMRVSSRHR